MQQTLLIYLKHSLLFIGVVLVSLYLWFLYERQIYQAQRDIIAEKADILFNRGQVVEALVLTRELDPPTREEFGRMAERQQTGQILVAQALGEPMPEKPSILLNMQDFYRWLDYRIVMRF
jgi:hypothetical protein